MSAKQRQGANKPNECNSSNGICRVINAFLRRFTRFVGRRSSAAPELVAIEHDDYHAKHIGHTTDGRQFFLTTPFVPAVGGNAGREFIALYLFNAEGHFLDAHIDDLGPRASLDRGAAESLHSQRLAELGDVSYARIEVQPFQIERFGTTFGLVLRVPEDKEDVWAVEAQPGNYMAFFEPFDSGEYDT